MLTARRIVKSVLQIALPLLMLQCDGWNLKILPGGLSVCEYVS